MSGLGPQLRYWFGLVGKPGLIGLVLLAAAVGIAASVVLPGERRIDSLAADLERARTAPPPVEEPQVQPVDAQLASFYQTFPKAGSTPDWLQRIYAAAEANQIVLDQGEYVLISDGKGRLDQYRIIFPLKGAYPQLRKFTAEVLREVPASALEAMQFKREKIADGQVDARITFLLYVEHGQ